ncbi:cation diffusion facilitator family transporter [Conexibacter sp. CPCC 206217]|uniref:cation diffusion facilitator family transporter n=1 Tax=Conexibacter sp. CPCC 206217 TaxID=3064574 RepID=UPI002721A672|nr:cation diffusion facilitator family transporter [Conexibacter sp. CPCC 206217]MDO8209454.1 cation diffusion facilitator family transporter [Conexibacter sp. CPCC 206217]
MAHEHGHSHGAGGVRDARALKIALALIVSFMLVEVVVGIIASSLALLSDAAHMLTDAAALALSLFALRIARRPARGAMTYGFGRVEILAAQANGITLLLLGTWITYEAITRLFDPPAVEGGLVLAIALLGIVVNIAATWVLARANRESLNVEGSFKHILTDLYAFIGTAIAGLIIVLTGFSRADPIASMVVAGLMLHAGYGLVKASGRVFLEAAPEGFDPQQIGRTLAAHPGVVEVHDLHVWEVTSGFPALSAHVVVRTGIDVHELRMALAEELTERFDLHHTTLQIDHEQGPLQIQVVPAALADGDAAPPGGRQAGEGVTVTSPSDSRAPEK